MMTSPKGDYTHVPLNLEGGRVADSWDAAADEAGGISAVEGVAPGASVPHYVPDENPFVDEMTKTYGVPRDAAVGMPETLYPSTGRR
jgi:hypothetical protein